jgi:co-chaperonin GroES (HSP10)
MTSKDIQESLGHPTIERLRDVKGGLRVKCVVGPRVLVRPVHPDTELNNAKKLGLVIPEHIEKANVPPPSTGVIVLVGDTDAYHPGEMILFSQFAGANFLINREEYKILDVNEIWAILEEVGES